MYFKQFFKTPDARSLACRDLEESKRLLLSMQSTAEHAVKMVEYYEGVVTRLSNYIQKETTQG